MEKNSLEDLGAQTFVLPAVEELTDMQLALVGGGIAETIL
jgi:hypothetical protein